MNDGRSDRATVRFHGTTSSASTSSAAASEAVTDAGGGANAASEAALAYHLSHAPALCNGYNANAEACVMDMRFACFKLHTRGFAVITAEIQ